MKESVFVKPFAFISFMVGVIFSSGVVFADYDVVLTGVNRFQGTVSYADKSIHIPEGALLNMNIWCWITALWM
jgi:hypothetical protein